MRSFILSLVALAVVASPVASSEAQAADVRLEFQGRLDVFNTFGVPGVIFPLGSGGGLGGAGDAESERRHGAAGDHWRPHPRW